MQQTGPTLGGEPPRTTLPVSLSKPIPSLHVCVCMCLCVCVCVCERTPPHVGKAAPRAREARGGRVEKLVYLNVFVFHYLLLAASRSKPLVELTTNLDMTCHDTNRATCDIRLGAAQVRHVTQSEASWAGKRVRFPLRFKSTGERFHFCRNHSPWTENGRAWE